MYVQADPCMAGRGTRDPSGDPSSHLQPLASTSVDPAHTASLRSRSLAQAQQGLAQSAPASASTRPGVSIPPQPRRPQGLAPLEPQSLAAHHHHHPSPSPSSSSMHTSQPQSYAAAAAAARGNPQGNGAGQAPGAGTAAGQGGPGQGHQGESQARELSPLHRRALRDECSAGSHSSPSTASPQPPSRPKQLVYTFPSPPPDTADLVTELEEFYSYVEVPQVLEHADSWREWWDGDQGASLGLALVSRLRGAAQSLPRRERDQALTLSRPHRLPPLSPLRAASRRHAPPHDPQLDRLDRPAAPVLGAAPPPPRARLLRARLLHLLLLLCTRAPVPHPRLVRRPARRRRPLRRVGRAAPHGARVGRRECAQRCACRARCGACAGGGRGRG